MVAERLSWGGVLARWVGALILVYATYNPERVSYYHWVFDPLLGGPASELGGPTPLKFIAGILLLIGWVVFLQAARRSLGAKGVLLALALVGGVIWLLIDQRVIAAESTRALAHIALVSVSLVLALGLSWSLLSRRVTGQVDIDRVD